MEPIEEPLESKHAAEVGVLRNDHNTANAEEALKREIKCLFKGAGRKEGAPTDIWRVRTWMLRGWSSDRCIDGVISGLAKGAVTVAYCEPIIDEINASRARAMTDKHKGQNGHPGGPVVKRKLIIRGKEIELTNEEIEAAAQKALAAGRTSIRPNRIKRPHERQLSA